MQFNLNDSHQRLVKSIVATKHNIQNTVLFANILQLQRRSSKRRLLEKEFSDFIFVLNTHLNDISC